MRVKGGGKCEKSVTFVMMEQSDVIEVADYVCVGWAWKLTSTPPPALEQSSCPHKNTYSDRKKIEEKNRRKKKRGEGGGGGTQVVAAEQGGGVDGARESG